jgi:hypothetical protein
MSPPFDGAGNVKPQRRGALRRETIVRWLRALPVILGMGVLFAPQLALAQVAKRTPVLTTHYFAFYSDLPTNLNDALVNAGVARRFRKPELFRSGEEAACFEKLPASARAGWEDAVDYYAKSVSPKHFGDREQALIRYQLAGFDDEISGDAAREYLKTVAGVRAAAEPAYKLCRWTAQDAKNRQWIQDLKKRLAAHEERIGSRLQQLYQTKWAPPIPVDVVQTVDWSGANTMLLREPGRGHVLVAIENEMPQALEIVFHEASHVLVGRGAPVMDALGKAAAAAHYTLPGDLWHVVLFFTTGEAVREVLTDAGEPGYKPVVYSIFERNKGWASYRSALESAWLPYVQGKESLASSAHHLIAALQTAKQP